MEQTVWVLSCNDQEQPPYKSFDILAVARSKDGIDRYLQLHWSDDEHEMRTTEEGSLEERSMTDDGWEAWEIPSVFDSPFVLALAEVPLEDETASEEDV
jgi:hypothetical protein